MALHSALLDFPSNPPIDCTAAATSLPPCHRPTSSLCNRDSAHRALISSPRHHCVPSNQALRVHVREMKALASDPTVLDLANECERLVEETYGNLSQGEWNALRQTLSGFFHMRRVKVSLFLQEGMQSADARIRLRPPLSEMKCGRPLVSCVPISPRPPACRSVVFCACSPQLISRASVVISALLQCSRSGPLSRRAAASLQLFDFQLNRLVRLFEGIPWAPSECSTTTAAWRPRRCCRAWQSKCLANSIVRCPNPTPPPPPCGALTYRRLPL